MVNPIQPKLGYIRVQTQPKSVGLDGLTLPHIYSNFYESLDDLHVFPTLLVPLAYLPWLSNDQVKFSFSMVKGWKSTLATYNSANLSSLQRAYIFIPKKLFFYPFC